MTIGASSGQTHTQGEKVMTTQEFVNSTNAMELTALLNAAVYALRAGVDPADVADRLASALEGGYGHVAYASEALITDAEELA